MQEFIAKYASLIFANWQRALLGGIIVVSVVIVLLGCLKGALINKITNKLARKIILAFSSVVLVFPLTALYFVVDGINFDHYWLGSAMNVVLTILAYWAYENTALRDFIHWVGKTVINKFTHYFVLRVTDVDNTQRANTTVLKETMGNLKVDVANQLVKSNFIQPNAKSSNHDTDLDNI
jgi:hypothetical protein